MTTRETDARDGEVAGLVEEAGRIEGPGGVGEVCGGGVTVASGRAPAAVPEVVIAPISPPSGDPDIWMLQRTNWAQRPSSGHSWRAPIELPRRSTRLPSPSSRRRAGSASTDHAEGRRRARRTGIGSAAPRGRLHASCAPTQRVRIYNLHCRFPDNLQLRLQLHPRVGDGEQAARSGPYLRGLA